VEKFCTKFHKNLSRNVGDVCSESPTSFSACCCHYADLGKAHPSSTNVV